MTEIAQQIVSRLGQMHAWEAVAVILSISYLLLAMRKSLWCWYCAFFSTVIYTVLFWEVNLLMDSALHVYYLLMAIYGWWQWNRAKSTEDDTHANFQIRTWTLQQHALTIGLVLVVSALSGYLLSQHTQAAWPYLDSFTTWASVVTTYMVAQKILENWLYWIVIDGVAVMLYIDRELYFTALLFIAYVIIVVFGFFAWRKEYHAYRYADA